MRRYENARGTGKRGWRFLKHYAVPKLQVEKCPAFLAVAERQRVVI
jgi:hypothetical protein